MSLHAAGVSDQAIEDAIAVCMLFNILDRLADALGFTVLSAEDFAKQADFLLTFGYQPAVRSS